MSGEVILGYDGSEGAKAALQEAVAFAKAFGAPLVLAFGYEPPPIGGEVADLRKAVERRGKEVLLEATAMATSFDEDVQVEALLIDERPAESLVELAEQRRARMIVTGHRRAGPLKGAIMGSITYKILQEASCPVVVVKAPG